jgi:hypothetical protein
MPDEPTLADVLEEVRASRRATAEALASTVRNIETTNRLFTAEVRVMLRDMESRIIGSDIKVDQALARFDTSLAQIRQELHELRELVQELLGLAHTHPEGTL